MDSYKDFKDKLDNEHNWPTKYMFKFVVPSSKTDAFKSMFLSESMREKKSKAGNYVSFTFKKLIGSSDEVVDIYIKAKKIEGLIAL